MRVWKMRKRFLKVSGGKRLTTNLLIGLCFAFVTVGAILAIASSVPSNVQPKFVISCWFFAVVGGAMGLWLYAIRYRLASRLLAIAGSALAFSLVAAAVKALVKAS